MISDKVDDMSIVDLLAKAEAGNEYARRCAWAKVIECREMVRNRTLVFGDDDTTHRKLSSTITDATARLRRIEQGGGK